jgi:hypothetical protein
LEFYKKHEKNMTGKKKATGIKEMRLRQQMKKGAKQHGGEDKRLWHEETQTGLHRRKLFDDRAVVLGAI